MPDPRHLKSTPISEALFDIRVQARIDFDIRDFSQLKIKLQKRFPTVDERLRTGFQFQIDEGQIKPPTIEEPDLLGFFFKSEDEKLIAQFRIDGFTLNKLPPYTSYNELLPIMTELWEHYYSIASPVNVTRLALRFINHIQIRDLRLDFDDYLSAGPVIPNELPQTLNAFFSRVTIVDDENKIAAHVSQAYRGPPSEQGIKIILDIDAHKVVDISPEDPELISIFNKLRDFKNMIFFNFLTKKTIRMFE